MENRRIKSIDVAKGIAMLMVIIVHYNSNFFPNISVFRFGQMGCQIFFVTSGYGIAASFSKTMKLYKNKKEACKMFYSSRFKAIAPAWWIMMVIVYGMNTLWLKVVGHSLNFGTNRGIVSIILNLLFLNGLFPFCNSNVMPGGVVYRNNDAFIFNCTGGALSFGEQNK
jgi:peptidoglycan/LPS O-acetylase OafA/YrhL